MIYLQAFKDGIRPDPYIDIATWSDEHRRLPRESSVEPGKYRTSRTPYTREIMVELSPQSPCQVVVFVKPTQVGATEIGNNFLFCTAKRYPGPSLMAFPTDKMAEKHSKKKLAPSVAAMRVLDDVIPSQKSRKGGNTLLLKEYPGGSWTLTGSNSGTAARSDSIRYLILDDLDGFESEVGDEGDPADLFIKRCDAFGDKKKIYKNSTPVLKGASKIDAEWDESSQGHYNVPCPAPGCGKFQFLEFGGVGWKYGIKFTRDEAGEIVDVWYVCKHCGARIEEYQKTAMMDAGQYIHTFPERKKRGFKINGLYSPLGWFSWRDLADEFLSAAAALKRGDNRKMKVWTNTRLAEAYEESGEQPEWSVLSARAEPYKPLTVPSGGMLLCAGVDTHDNRLDIKVKAYGPGEESWTIHWGTIWGDPDTAEPWIQLDAILNMPFRHTCGVDLRIISMAIDTGGHRTQAVYNYCRLRGPTVIAIKGSSNKGRPILGAPTKQDVDIDGVKIEGGVELWPVGTDIAKGTIYNRLKLATPGPGFYHFHMGLDSEYYLQLTAEKLVKRFVKGFPVYEWTNTRPANHALDCDVYALAAAYRAGVQTADWQAIGKALGIDAPEPMPAPIVEPRVSAAPTRPGPPRSARRKEVRSQSGPGGYQRPGWMKNK